MQTADPKLYTKITATLTPEQKENFDAAIEAYKPIVKKIESNPIPTTKDNYGAYLSFVNSPIELAVALLAGGNRVGVLTAAEVNGIKLRN